jgi:hypothetical protein
MPPRQPVFRCCGVFLLGVLMATPAAAGQTSTPDAFSRDAEGRATIRAFRLSEPLRVDGVLDEAIYAQVPAVSDFIQNEPVNGSAATERTDVWLFYDDDNFYIVARCWESDSSRRVANEMRRDNNGVLRNDHFAATIDTFHDRRSAVLFNINPLGGRMDGQVIGEGTYNGDWNPVWDMVTGRFDGGWTLEAALPFKTLRYPAGTDQVWGFNARRRVVWKNESDYLSLVPPGSGLNGTTRPAFSGDLIGIQVPPASRNVEIKPYAVSALTTDRRATPAVSNDPSADVGLDVKYAITPNVAANFTLNTDFAQVEADEQQVNLTRFSLFFPEKREFFLENQGLFGFGGVAPTRGGDVPVMFYSRQIGLSAGQEVPIRGGGRLVGQAGPYSFGAVNIQSGADEGIGAPGTNFTVVRFKRDILQRSSLGAILTNRSALQSGSGAGQTYGLDAAFDFFANLSMNAYWARTSDAGPGGDGTSYRGNLNYNGDRYGLDVERLVVDSAFAPGVGFVRRPDMRKTSGSFRFSPRPQRIAAVRKFSYSASFSRIENHAGRLETRQWEGALNTELQSGDTFEVGYGGTYEFIPAPFTIARGIVVPVGGYDSTTASAQYAFGRQRRLSGTVSAANGTFYGGHLTTLGISQGRWAPANQLSLEPSLSINWVDLPQGDFTTRLVGSRVTYTVSPLMFVSALLQYSSSANAVSANIRLRWEYRPGSELFVVLNETRDALTPGVPDLTSRAVVVKITRLLTF